MTNKTHISRLQCPKLVLFLIPQYLKAEAVCMVEDTTQVSEYIHLQTKGCTSQDKVEETLIAPVMNKMLMYLPVSSTHYSHWMMSRKQAMLLLEGPKLFPDIRRETEEPKQHQSILFSPMRVTGNHCHRKKIKVDKKLLTTSEHKNTFGSSLGNTAKQEYTLVQQFHSSSCTCPTCSHANGLSKHISIHASLKETAFKLTFRWKWHLKNLWVRDQGAVGGKKCTHQSHFACLKVVYKLDPKLNFLHLIRAY